MTPYWSKSRRETEEASFEASALAPSTMFGCTGVLEPSCFALTDVAGWTKETSIERCLDAASANLFFITGSSSDLDRESC